MYASKVERMHLQNIVLKVFLDNKNIDFVYFRFNPPFHICISTDIIIRGIIIISARTADLIRQPLTLYTP